MSTHCDLQRWIFVLTWSLEFVVILLSIYHQNVSGYIRITSCSDCWFNTTPSDWYRCTFNYGLLCWVSNTYVSQLCLNSALISIYSRSSMKTVNILTFYREIISVAAWKQKQTVHSTSKDAWIDTCCKNLYKIKLVK